MPDPLPPAPPPAIADEQRFSVFDPETASYVTVPESELGQAADYYGAENIESPEQTALRKEREQYDTLGNTALAAGAGAARGATLGLSDVAAEQLGLAEELSRAKRLNPVVSGVSEAGGTLAGMGKIGALVKGGKMARGAALGLDALSAPAAGAMRAGALAEGLAGRALGGIGITGEGYLGRAALQGGKMAASGAVEGSLFGAGQAMSEAVLSGGDYDSLAEKMLIGAKEGGVFGALAGASLGGGLGLASRAGEALAPRLKSALHISDEVANERALKALGARGTDIRKLGTEAKIQQIGQDLRDIKLRDGTPLIAMGDNAEQIAAKVQIAKREATEDLARIRQTVEDAGDAVDARSYLDRVRKEVLDPLHSSPSPSIRARAAKVEDELSSLTSRVERAEAAQAAAPGLAQRIDDGVLAKLSKSRNAADRELAATHRATLADFAAQAKAGTVSLDAVRGITDNVLMPLASSTNKRTADAARRMMAEVEQVSTGLAGQVTYADLRAQQAALKEVVYPKSVPGQGLPAAPPEHADALLRSERLLESTMEDHVEKTLARVAPEQAGQYREVRRKAESMIKADTLGQKVVKQNLGNRVASPSDYGTAMAVMAGDLASGGVLSLAKGLAVGVAHNQIRTRGNSFLVALANRQATADLALGNAVRKFVRGANTARRFAIGELAEAHVSESFRKQGEDKLKAFRRVSAEINRMQVPDKMVTDIDAPQTGEAVRKVAARAAAFLKSKLPPGTTPANPLHEPLDPHPSEVDRFERYYRAVNDPDSVLRDLQNGTLSHEAAEAMRECYPKRYQQLQSAMISELAAHQGKLPHAKRMAIGILLNIPADRSLAPSAIYSAQQAHASQNPAGQPPRNTPPAKPMAKSFETQAQQLESGEVAL